jgi:hypothetical protein
MGQIKGLYNVPRSTLKGKGEFHVSRVLQTSQKPEIMWSEHTVSYIHFEILDVMYSVTLARHIHGQLIKLLLYG